MYLATYRFTYKFLTKMPTQIRTKFEKTVSQLFESEIKNQVAHCPTEGNLPTPCRCSLSCFLRCIRAHVRQDNVTSDENFSKFSQNRVTHSSFRPFCPPIGRKSWSQSIKNCTRIQMDQKSSKSELSRVISDHFLKIQNSGKMNTGIMEH